MNEYTRTYDDGDKCYYKDREMTILHREDGPAIEHTDGDKSWYLNGKLHRIDGPAVEFVTGRKVWFINGALIFDINRNGNVVDRMR